MFKPEPTRSASANSGKLKYENKKYIAVEVF